MQPTVERIVQGVPSGMVFDSHYVIDTLIKERSDVYLSFAAQQYPNGQASTPNFHAQIAVVIRGLTHLVSQPQLRSWSYSIHDKAVDCELWQRL